MKASPLPPLVSQIHLSFRSGEPIYLQVIAQVKALISSDVLKAGDQLPTVRALAQELRINFNTVARAYRMLDEAGIISTQQGRGTYILDSPLPEKREEFREQALKSLSERYLQDATQLGASPEKIQQVINQSIADWCQSDEK